MTLKGIITDMQDMLALSGTAPNASSWEGCMAGKLNASRMGVPDVSYIHVRLTA